MTKNNQIIPSQTNSPAIVISRQRFASTIVEALELQERTAAVLSRLQTIDKVMTRVFDRTVASFGKPTPEIISLMRGLDEELVVAFLRYETASKAAGYAYAEIAAELGANVFEWKESIQAALRGDVETLQGFIKNQTTEPIRKQFVDLEAIIRAGRPKGTVGVHHTTETLGKFAESLKSQDPTERWQNIAAQLVAILKEAPEESPEGDALKLLQSQPYSKQGNFLKERHRLYLKALKRLVV